MSIADYIMLCLFLGIPPSIVVFLFYLLYLNAKQEQKK